VPPAEECGALPITHPRYLTFPKVGKGLDGDLMYYSTRQSVEKLHEEESIDLIDAHWAYPDGYAAMRVAQSLDIPYTVTVRGDDLSETTKDPVRREKITKTLSQAAHVFAVCAALRDAAVDLGISENKVSVVGNGVDLDMFFPSERKSARRSLGLVEHGKVVVSVGHLCKRKGFDILIDAIAKLHAKGIKDLCLVIVGGAGEEGDVRRELEEKAQSLPRGVVRLVGPKLPSELRLWYSAADVCCLASSREGWANVLLESLACGTPVVATDVWGTPEVIDSPSLGMLVDRNSAAFAQAIELGLNRRWDTETIVAKAKNRTWGRVAQELWSFIRDLDIPRAA